MRDDKGRFKQGESGNPNGRPKKGQTLTDALEEEFTKEELAAHLRVLVEKNDLNAIKYVYDRVEGKPRERVETIIETPRTVGYYPQSTDTEDTEANTE